VIRRERWVLRREKRLHDSESPIVKNLDIKELADVGRCMVDGC